MDAPIVGLWYMFIGTSLAYQTHRVGRIWGVKHRCMPAFFIRAIVGSLLYGLSIFLFTSGARVLWR